MLYTVCLTSTIKLSFQIRTLKFHSSHKTCMDSTQHSGISTTHCQLTIVTSIPTSTRYIKELEIKDTTESASSVAYLDILLEMDTDGYLTT